MQSKRLLVELRALKMPHADMTAEFAVCAAVRGSDQSERHTHVLREVRACCLDCQRVVSHEI